MGENIINIEDFFRSRKNANCILDLEKSLLSTDENTILSSIGTVQELISEIFNRNMLCISANIAHKEEEFRLWLFERYRDFVIHLISLLTHTDERIQEKSLEVLLVFVKLEAEKPQKSSKEGVGFSPNEVLKKVLSSLASKDIDQQSLIMKFQKYAEYSDLKMYLLKTVSFLLQKDDMVTDIFLQNCFNLLSAVKYPKEFTSKEIQVETEPHTWISQESTPFLLKKKVFSRLFSSSWISFLKFPLPNALMKKVLLILQKKVVPFVNNPCLLTDFLTDCYNQGGIVSLLALNGLFFLIDKYNVDYPDFFLKLYSLFDKDIVNGKFSDRFFYLADLFLSSRHLPSLVVAAFAKRLSRIALSSKTECILRIIPFICNLVIRHPILQCLVHRPDSSELSEDPYDFHAPDPADSRAIESSLWEVKTLQKHLNPEVSRKAKLINQKMPKLEFDLVKTLETTADDLYKKERKRKFVGCPVSIQKHPKLDNWWIL